MQMLCKTGYILTISDASVCRFNKIDRKSDGLGSRWKNGHEKQRSP